MVRHHLSHSLRHVPRGAALLVEFVGPAGVGKSSIASGVLTTLSANGVPSDDLLLIPIRPTLGNLIRGLRAALLALRLRPISLRAYKDSADRLARHKIRYDLCGRNMQIYICDEGMFHRIRKLYRNSASLTMLQVAKRVFDFSPVPDVVVIIQASTETIFSRRLLRNRMGDHFSLSSVAEDVALLEDTIRTVRAIQQSHPGKLQVISADSEKSDLRQTVTQIAMILAHRFQYPYSFQNWIDLSDQRT